MKTRKTSQTEYVDLKVPSDHSWSVTPINMGQSTKSYTKIPVNIPMRTLSFRLIPRNARTVAAIFTSDPKTSNEKINRKDDNRR